MQLTLPNLDLLGYVETRYYLCRVKSHKTVSHSYTTEIVSKNGRSTILYPGWPKSKLVLRRDLIHTLKNIDQPPVVEYWATNFDIKPITKEYHEQ